MSGSKRHALAYGNLPYKQKHQSQLVGCCFLQILQIPVSWRRESQNLLTTSVSLHWKMVSLGTQGKIAPEKIVRVLHIYVNKMDVQAAKPWLTTLYTENASVDHRFPLHIQMWLVPEIDSVLNTQGRRKIGKLHACQATWTMTKLVLLKTWEIEFLNKHNPKMGMSLRDAMMAIKHLANPHFSLFHSIDWHWKDDCYIITCLKLADSLAHAMITALLPYLTWMLEKQHSKAATAQVPKWFKPSMRIWAADTFWDPKEECVWNKSDKMLNLAILDADGLYWEVDTPDPNTPKCKKVKVDNKSVTDSMSTVQTAVSSLRTWQTSAQNECMWPKRHYQQKILQSWTHRKWYHKYPQLHN